MNDLFASLRVCLATMLVCVVGYTAVVLGFAAVCAPDTASGSLLRAKDGTVVGSRLLAQAFTRPEYFWPRPSACDWNGAAAGGSNLSPCNPALAERAQQAIARFGASAANPLPADLATASGSGLDPHISAAAARFQVARVAAARNLPAAEVQAVVDRLAVAPGPFPTGERLVNVLELNLALERR
ncbi:MAG: potassium-transporting ATPase subunit KdpC [Planctomycetes bacterium]|nr:potassium-transporting ATPase subunit KdpC [Planctomycetota bacterium]